MSTKSNIIFYEEMKIKTMDFYKSINIKVKENKISLAITSLTMPQYEKEYNDKINNEINSGLKNEKDMIKCNNALATVGDAICGAYLMIEKFDTKYTMEELTALKETVTNENLNIIGKKLLENHLFFSNNDLDDINKKSYATAFEAVVGFITLNNKVDVIKFLDEYLKDYK